MVTAEVINRVLFVKVADYGSATVVDVDGRQYLVTAKHLLRGESEVSSIKFYFNGKWENLNVKIVGVARGGADIAVFATDTILCPSSLPLMVGNKDMVLSQDVYFLGYPFKLSTDGGAALQGRPCPFVKKGIWSSLFDDGTGDYKLYIDAINNEGFSGGPIVFKVSGTNKFSLAGIVSKYRTEHGSVVCEEGNSTGWTVEYNTGLTIGTDISEAVKIINQNPIGLLLPI
ncbi:trypsin-like peptidase domain-containing protein [Cellvibrio mixtus]|uniref:trypsin-like peptidase domain-containing protein n=1 Tax=Cellvibrio mixtus TaxID=39650 RepID=UPI0005872B9A|nr:trypsin-like peptidase domain-containing protein [Cellvibrio mixtus]